MNGVIYARYSSHNQREESIEGQIRKCRAYAEQNNITIIGEYIDRAMSGKTDKRDDFQRLIKDSAKGHFQAVIMYTLDRFARNRYDSAHYKAQLKKNGVRLFYTEQSITDEPEGIILESVLEGMAEYYSENLSRGIKRGMHENALKCMITGGYMPLGYRKTADKKFEIDPATAPIVKEIFDLYANGKTQRQIVDILNEKGYRTVKGMPFRLGSISGILVNKKYIGIYSYNDLEIENGVPAIIDRETFDKVQEMLKRNKRTTGRMKAPAQYMLTGKIFCGHCGSSMCGESGTSQTGTIYNYYKCSDRKKRGTCKKAAERKDWIEQLVVKETINRILQPGVIREIAHKVAELAEKEFNDHSRLISLQNELKVTQTSIRNLLRLVEQGIDTDDVGDRLLDLNAQKSDLMKQISVEENKKPLVSAERLEFWLTDLLTNGDINSPDYQQRIIDTLVNKIFVFDTDDNGGKKIVITYNTSNSGVKSTITLSDIKKYLKSSDFEGFARPNKKVHPTGWTFLFAGWRDSNNLNATRMSVAADGRTEANLYFRQILGENANESRHSDPKFQNLFMWVLEFFVYLAVFVLNTTFSSPSSYAIIFQITYAISGGSSMANIDDFYRNLTGVDIETQKLLWDERGKGYYGEYLVFGKLYPELSGCCKILMNLQIPTSDGRTTEIDLLLIHETGLYVFEVKHYKGTIYGKSTDQRWTQYFRTSPNFHFYNPILQNRYHIKALQKMFPNIPIYSLIVFTSPESDLRVECNEPDITVCQLSNLYIPLHLLETRNKLFDINYIDSVFNMLVSFPPSLPSMLLLMENLFRFTNTLTTSLKISIRKKIMSRTLFLQQKKPRERKHLPQLLYLLLPLLYALYCPFLRARSTTHMPIVRLLLLSKNSVSLRRSLSTLFRTIMGILLWQMALLPHQVYNSQNLLM